jgi:plasmid stabilization system protein ParE
VAEITWTEEAERWLNSIFEYIAQENPAAATKTVLGIYERAQVLKEFPQLGQRRSPPRESCSAPQESSRPHEDPTLRQSSIVP